MPLRRERRGNDDDLNNRERDGDELDAFYEAAGTPPLGRSKVVGCGTRFRFKISLHS
jgi:hypothetical protein